MSSMFKVRGSNFLPFSCVDVCRETLNFEPETLN